MQTSSSSRVFVFPDSISLLSGMPVTKIKGLAETNEVSHHTERYETPGLFLRRGQTFTIEIELQRAFKEDEDKFTIKFETGKYPKKRNNTLVVVTKVQEFEKVNHTLTYILTALLLCQDYYITLPCNFLSIWARTNLWL